MKKFVIGLAIVGTYGAYSIGVRHVRPVLAQPTLLAKSTSSSTISSNNSSKSSVTSTGSPPPLPASNGSQYKDGSYSGSVDYVYYGNVQVSVTISGGKITNANFLQYPNSHSTSVFINQQAMPYLIKEAIKTQNPNNIQIISGATFTSEGFIKSLQSALTKA